MSESERIMGNAKALERFKASDGYRALVELIGEWHNRIYESFMESLDPKDLLRLKIEGEVVHKILGFLDDRVAQGRKLAEDHRARLEREQAEAEQEQAAIMRRRGEQRARRYGGSL